jgi:hypothetical protein
MTPMASRRIATETAATASGKPFGRMTANARTPRRARSETHSARLFIANTSKY